MTCCAELRKGNKVLETIPCNPETVRTDSVTNGQLRDLIAGKIGLDDLELSPSSKNVHKIETRLVELHNQMFGSSGRVTRAIHQRDLLWRFVLSADERFRIAGELIAERLATARGNLREAESQVELRKSIVEEREAAASAWAAREAAIQAAIAQ